MIRGGREGYDRLRVLARVHEANTTALLDRVGVAPGMRCADVGCGGGDVTFVLARLVGPGGSVVGLDMDQVKLDLAAEQAAELGLDNVRFQAADITDWSEPGAYDLVYSRFLLEHLRRPVELLRQMWAAVRPGGVIVVEDADFDGCFTDPQNAGHDFYQRVYTEALRRRGGDAAIGRKLYRLCLEAGIPDPEFGIVQGAAASGEIVELPHLTLAASAEAVIAEGIASAEEVERARAEMEAFGRLPGSVVGGPRVCRVWQRREDDA